MKINTIITTIVAYTILTFGLLQTTSCVEKQVQASTNIKTKDNTKTERIVEIPALQQREGKLAELPEWSAIWEKGQNLHQKVELTGDAKSALYLAAIYMQEARITGEHPYYYNAALDVLNFVIENPPKEKILQYQALTSKASVLLSQHQFQEALEAGQAALKIETHDAQVYGVLCDANVELGNYEEAVKMGDKMISIKPDLRSYARVSYLRELFGDYKGAIAAMELAIAAGVPSHENTAWARHTLANLYLEYGDLKNAKIELETCLAERPTYAFAIATLADIELEEGNIEVASQKIDEACALMPEFSFFVTKAKIQKAQGKEAAFDKTRQELLVMLKEDTESGHNMSLETANIYLELFSDTDKALTVVMDEYKKRPNNNEVNKLMGTVYFQKEDYKNAQDYFEKASTTKWQAPELLCMRGITLCENGDYKQGKEALTTSLKYKKSLDKALYLKAQKMLGKG